MGFNSGFKGLKKSQNKYQKLSDVKINCC